MIPLRLLIVEDSSDDAFLVERTLAREGFALDAVVVETREQVERALDGSAWDVVISDFALSGFTALEVIRAVRGRGLDVPLIVVSGTIGEELAVETMRAGADDYLMKGKLQRLPLAVRRELREAEQRRERRAAEEKLRLSEQLMSQAQAIARMGHFAWDLAAGEVVWSDQLYRIHGVDPSSFVPSLESWLALVHENDRERARDEVGACTSGGTLATSVRIVTPDAGEKTVEILGDVDCSPDGVPVRMFGVLKDVTETRAAALENRRMEAELARANRLSSLGRMAATIAHEFNNVLMGIQPFAELLLRKAPDEGARTASEHILRSVQRGRRVTQDILRYTRPAEPARQHVALCSLFAELDRELRGILPPSVELQIEAEADVTIEVDPQQIAQVLLNLGINARDAMPRGGALRITATACRETPGFAFVPGAPERFAHLVVRDTGTGIPPEALEQIFEPFFTMKKLGTGLGLAVARKTMEAHGGSIVAESEVGKGTAFHLFLPLAVEVRASDAPPISLAAAV